MSRRKGKDHIRKIKYHGMYMKGQNWEFESPQLADEDDYEWFGVNVLKKKQISFGN